MEIYLVLSTILLGEGAFYHESREITPYRYMAKACAEIEKHGGELFVLDLSRFRISGARCKPGCWDVVTSAQ